MLYFRKKNYTYSRAIFASIEFIETHNIPVPIAKMTVEHIMPQALSKDWVKDLGGDEASKKAYELLNSIGNLAIISREGNSGLGQGKYSDKKKEILKVQFNVTSEVGRNFDVWDIDTIKKRSNDISSRIVSAFPQPLERTREITVAQVLSIDTGWYDISEAIPNGVDIEKVEINGEEYPCDAWRRLVVMASEYVASKNKSVLDKVVNENKISKNTSKRVKGSKDPNFTRNKQLLAKSMPIAGTDFFCEGNVSGIIARKLVVDLMKELNSKIKTRVYISSNEES